MCVSLVIDGGRKMQSGFRKHSGDGTAVRGVLLNSGNEAVTIFIWEHLTGVYGITRVQCESIPWANRALLLIKSNTQYACAIYVKFSLHTCLSHLLWHSLNNETTNYLIHLI